jgi:very-short-patch-repair endonuclease
MAALAERQHGVVARRQLLALGLTPTMVLHRIRSGPLVLLHRGVYAVGHRRLRREGFLMAATMAAGDGAVLSHRDAAWMHDLWRGERATVEVTTAGRPSRHPNLRIYPRRPLAPEDLTVVDGIPTTSVARTLVDLADVLPPHQLTKVLSEAERLHTFDGRAIEAAYERTWGRNGCGPAALRAALDELRRVGARLTRSELEERFVALVDAAHLPRPRLNAHVEGMEVDALWPDRRLVVELDGYAFHHHRAAWQRDHEKTNALKDLGYDVRRFTHRDVVEAPGRTATRLARALRAAAGPSS